MYVPGTCSNGTVAGQGITTTAGLSGLGCAECGGTCGGMNGLSMDGSGLFGTGIFGTGVDIATPATWSAFEWVTLLGGAFMLLSTLDMIRNIGRHTAERGRRIKSGFTSPITPKSKSKKKSKR